MDETLIAELESAIADTGALLVRLQKYRRGTGPEGQALAREAMALGDAARRLHRRDALDVDAASRLLADARTLTARLQALVDAVRSAPDYRAAVAAHAAGDHATLARLLPAIFAGLEPAALGGDLFAAIPWLRRGRLRPVEDVTADVRSGLLAEGDDLSPGADPELPAVALAAMPPDDPVLLCIPATTLTGPAHRLESGDILLHVPRLRVDGRVVLAPRLELDEQLRVEISQADWTTWKNALATALRAAAIRVENA